MSQLRSSMVCDVRSLISHLTGFHEDEENFSLCLDFAASNLLYHTCLDPEERNVNRWMDGLREKLLVHAERDKARDLERLLDRYRQGEVFKEFHEQRDVGTRLLSLLQHLSEGALRAEWTGAESDLRQVPEEQDEEEQVDWAKLLAEGEEEWRPGSGEDDLSEWSTDQEEEQEEPKGEHSKKTVSGKSPEVSAPSLTSSSTSSRRLVFGEDEEDPVERLSKMVQPQYWRDARCEPRVDSDLPSTARFSSRVDALMRAAGVNTVHKVSLSEYQLLRECLWSLRMPLPSTVFKLDDETGDFSMRENVCLPSITAGTLGHALAPLCSVMKHVKELQDFCLHVFSEQGNFNSDIPRTYEAYASAMHEVGHYP